MKQSKRGETEQKEPDKNKKKERIDELKRNFSGEDAAFLEKNRTVLTLFEREQALFTALDPTLDAAFKVGWLALIETCESHTTDETMLDILREKTTKLERYMSEVTVMIDELEFYVKKAFPANPALWQEFGFRLRRNAKNSNSRFILWMYTMFRVLEDYEAQLLAAAMPLTFKTEFDATLGNCADAELEQEHTKRLRLRQTRLRVEQLNRLHQYLQRVQNAAQIIYRNNEAKRKSFS